MSVALQTSAGAALDKVVGLLVDHGVEATRDAGAFNPDPVGVIVGMPSWVGSTLAGRIFEIPIQVVAGSPLNEPGSVDRLYSEADRVADIVDTAGYRPGQWSSSARVESLFAVEIIATVIIELEV